MVALNGAGIREPCPAGLLVDPHAGLLKITAQQRLLAHGRGHLPDTSQQPGIIN